VEGKSALNQTVLLVDDNPIQLSARQMVLSQAGVEVQVATSAESALALLRTLSQAERIGVIVTDHVMPQATGSEFVRLVREVNPQVPVIVISGLPEADREYEGLNVIFRQKPCPPPELIDLVQAAARRS
jgi:DNA-binding NtrC family response regulator